MNPYAPYRDLPALTDAAGLSVGEMDHHSTVQLLAVARERSESRAPVCGADVSGLPLTGAPYTVASTRLPVGLHIAATKKAKANHTTFSAVVADLVHRWVTS